MDLQFNFDQNFQQSIIKLMVEDADFGRKASQYLQKSYFSNKILGWFFDVICKTINEYECCNWLAVDNEVYKFDDDKRKDYDEILAKIKDRNLVSDAPQVRKKLEPFTKKAIAFQINNRLVAAQHKDPDKIIKIIDDDLDRLKYLSFAEADMMKLDEVFNILDQSAETMKDLLPLGIPEIDDALMGGIPRQTLTLAIGGTNVGKSIFLINCTWNFIKTGHKVLYVSLEGEKHQAYLRLLSRATQIPYGKIRANDLTDKQVELVEQFRDEYKDQVRMKHIDGFGFKIEDFIPFCRDVYRDFPFDAVVLDYGQIMGTKEKFNSIRERQMHVHRGLASMGTQFNCGVVTVAQGNREAQSKNDTGDRLLRMTDISECFELARTAATVLTLNRSDQDEATDKVRILMDKQREGRKGVLQICRTDMSFIGLYGDDEEGLGFVGHDEVPNDTRISDIPVAPVAPSIEHSCTK